MSSHFSVQIAFTVVVFPCLLLQYTGQAAYIAQNKDHVSHAFYFSLPGNVGLRDSWFTMYTCMHIDTIIWYRFCTLAIIHCCNSCCSSC